MKTPIEYIKEAWGIYTKKENFIFFAKIMAVLVILGAAISFVTSYFYPADYLQNADYSNTPIVIGFIVLSLTSAVIGIWSLTTQYYSILKMGSSEKEVFKLGYKNMWRFLLISLVVGLIVLGGTILLIIPAIIFGVWYSLSTFLVLDKNMRIREALKTSKLMVKDKFWKVLGRFVAFGLFSIIVSVFLSIIPYAGSLLLSFIAPLFLLPTYLLYRDLSVNN